LQRRRKVEAGSDWYLPCDFIARLLGQLPTPTESWQTIHPWPLAHPFAFVLTHDVETAEGMRHIARLADMEESLGFRSSWNLVPYKYPIDEGLLRDLRQRGFEIGVHGYNHDGRLYASQRIFRKRAPLINDAIRRYQAVGFRSPMVHRNLQWLQQLDIEYDASCFDIDPHQAMPGGVGTLWPFIAGKFVELPYTLPQDHTLFIAMGQNDSRIWQRKLEFVARNHGMALMVTHPDYLGPRYLQIYRDFLLHVKAREEFWHALPRDVTAWWRRREDSSIAPDQHGAPAVAGAAQDEGRLAEVSTAAGSLVLTPVRRSAKAAAIA
jgi:peptidoglycan/xylan/chitin deacetylase (PgdA/CDA1 family)